MFTTKVISEKQCISGQSEFHLKQMYKSIVRQRNVKNMTQLGHLKPITSPTKPQCDINRQLQTDTGLFKIIY